MVTKDEINTNTYYKIGMVTITETINLEEEL